MTNNVLLEQLYANANQQTSGFIDFSNNTLIEICHLQSCTLNSFDTSSFSNCTQLLVNSNNLTAFDASSLTSCVLLQTHGNSLDNLVNSQILIDLDGHGLSDGYFRSSISGGGTLTTAGLAAKAALLLKGWTIVGL